MRVLDTGQKKRTFHTVAFSPDGVLAAAGDGHPTVVWDVTSGELLHHFVSTGYTRWPVHFHPLSGHLFVPSGGGLRVFDPRADVLAQAFPGGENVTALAFDPRDGWCVSCYQDGGAKLSAAARVGEPDERVLWRVPLCDAPDERGYAYHLACLSDGERFLSAEHIGPRAGNAYNSYRLTLRARSDGRVLSRVGIFGYGNRAFASPAADVVAVMFNTSVTAHPLSDLSSARPVIRNDTRKHFTALAFHPSGKYLAAASNDATIKLYDTATWEVARTFTWDIGKMRSVAFSPDGTLAAAGSDKGKVVVWDVDV